MTILLIQSITLQADFTGIYLKEKVMLGLLSGLSQAILQAPVRNS